MVSPIGTRKVARQGQAFSESPKTGILAATVKIGGDGPAAMLLAFGHEHQRLRRFRRHRSATWFGLGSSAGIEGGEDRLPVMEARLAELSLLTEDLDRQGRLRLLVDQGSPVGQSDPIVVLHRRESHHTETQQANPFKRRRFTARLPC